MLVKQVTKEELLEIMKWEDDGGCPVEIVYEVIEDEKVGKISEEEKSEEIAN